MGNKKNTVFATAASFPQKALTDNGQKEASGPYSSMSYMLNSVGRRESYITLDRGAEEEALPPLCY